MGKECKRAEEGVPELAETTPSESESMSESTTKEETPLGPDLLQQQLQEEREKAERYLASWQRAAADFQNYKRRAEQERSEAAKFANAMLLLNLLPVIDDLERALSTIPANLAGLTWIQGIALIQRKLQAVLEAQGLTEIKAEGEEFDPNLHEAVTYSDGEEGKVVAVFQKGYRLHDRVIRPAMVAVGKLPESPPAESAEPQG